MSNQRIYVEIGDKMLPMLPLLEIEESSLKGCTPADLIGIPYYWCMTQNDGLKLWPKPVKACKIWRLEPQIYAE